METAGVRALSSHPRSGGARHLRPFVSSPSQPGAHPALGLPLARLLPVPRALRPLLPSQRGPGPGHRRPPPAARLAHREQRRLGERAPGGATASVSNSQPETHRGPLHAPVGRLVGRRPFPRPWGEAVAGREGGREADSSRARRGARWGPGRLRGRSGTPLRSLAS